MTKLTTEELREPWCLKCGRKASDHNVRHPFQPSHELPSIHDLAAENADLRAEVEKLRGEIKDVRRFADEWVISRAVGNLALESEKADQLWNRIRGASARTAPIEESAALGEGGE